MDRNNRPTSKEKADTNVEWLTFTAAIKVYIFILIYWCTS